VVFSIDDGADERRVRLTQMVFALREAPALVYDRHLTVLIANELAGEVQSAFTVGTNLARATFLVTDLDDGVDDGDQKREQVAAALRDAVQQHDEDRAYVELVGELAARSNPFAEAWATDLPVAPTGEFRFRDGMTLAYHRFLAPGPEGDTLLLWRGADEASTTKLASIAARLSG